MSKEEYQEEGFGYKDGEEITSMRDIIKGCLFTGSRASWGMVGGLAMLVFMSEKLFLENQLYPYAAKIVLIVAFLLACIFDGFSKIIEDVSK